MSAKGTGCCEAVTAEAMPRRRLGRPWGTRRVGFTAFSRQIARRSRKFIDKKTYGVYHGFPRGYKMECVVNNKISEGGGFVRIAGMPER